MPTREKGHVPTVEQYELDLSAIAEPVMDDLTFEIEPPEHPGTIEANAPALPAPKSA